VLSDHGFHAAKREDLKVLARHAPVHLIDSRGSMGPLTLTTLTPQCRHGREAGLLVDYVPWPCDEIRDLAEAYDIPTGDSP